jgi:hypothetical protein
MSERISMSLESWKVFFEVGGIVLLALTFVFGAGAWLVNNRLSLVQTKELEDFKLTFQEEQQKTASAQEEAAKAQLALKQYQDVIARSVNPRHLDSERFIKLLSGKPKGTVEIWYEPGDTEAYDFANELDQSLRGAGWGVRSPIAFLGLPPMGDRMQWVDSLRVSAESSGMAIAVRDITYKPDSMEASLEDAINRATGGLGMAGLQYWVHDPTLPGNHVKIGVGHHRVNVPLVELPSGAKQR